MQKIYKYYVIDLCGNPTLIINNRYKYINLEEIKQKYNVEQTGFFDFEKKYLEMEGKEFCGNGLRSAGICLGRGFWNIKTNVYPYEVKIIVTDTNAVLYLPKDMFTRNRNFIETEGISFSFKEIEFGFSNKPAEGIIKIEGSKIEPQIFVKKINSIINETACASGSIAAAIYSNKKEFYIVQPSGGKYFVQVTDDNIKLSSLYKILFAM